MRRRARRRHAQEIAAAQETVAESVQEAEAALAYQQRKAKEERETVLWPTRRLREVNHIAADIAYDLQQGGSGR